MGGFKISLGYTTIKFNEQKTKFQKEESILYTLAQKKPEHFILTRALSVLLITVFYRKEMANHIIGIFFDILYHRRKFKL